MVEGGCLLSSYTVTSRIVGSNPTLSAILSLPAANRLYKASEHDLIATKTFLGHANIRSTMHRGRLWTLSTFKLELPV